MQGLNQGGDDRKDSEARDDGRVWPDSRLLSPRFITQITARAPFTKAPADPAVRIYCAKLNSKVWLDHEGIPQSPGLTHGRLPQGRSISRKYLENVSEAVCRWTDQPLAETGLLQAK